MSAAAVPDLSASSGSSGPPIRMVQISKSFLGTHAVREVDLDVSGGEVHAIVGENGAGKSTLMRVLAGSYSDYSGDIYVNGAPERIETPRRARELGFALVHQELSLVPELSVAENMFLGREARSKIPGFIDRRATERRAAAILQEVEAGISPRDRVGSLSLAKQQLVEIAKGISTEPRVLILDEPTSSLTQPEIDDLFRVVRSAREKGVAILYISHKLPEIFALADRITVMRDGRKLSSRPVREWTEPELVREMVGRSLAEFFPRQHESIEPTPILEVRSLSQDPYFADVSFSIRRGEIVGIYGLIGSGRTRLGKALFGLARADSGEIRVNGKARRITAPAHGVAAGIAFVPEDRRVQGLVHVLGVGTNLTLARLKQLCTASFVRRRHEQALVQSNVRDLNIRAAFDEDAGLRSQRRKPAEGRARQVAQHRAFAADPRRADARNRRGREGRSPAEDRRARGERHGGAAHLLGASRDHGDERPDSRHAERTHRHGIRARPNSPRRRSALRRSPVFSRGGRGCRERSYQRKTSGRGRQSSDGTDARV